MRYRRCGYRYTMVLSSRDHQQLDEDWLIEKVKVLIPKSRWRPATDMYETKDALYITAELAGVQPDDFAITLYEDALVVEGHRRLSIADPEGIYHAAEIRQGAFRLVILLSTQIESEKIDAYYDQGLLQITLKKKGEPHDT